MCPSDRNALSHPTTILLKASRVEFFKKFAIILTIFAGYLAKLQNVILGVLSRSFKAHAPPLEKCFNRDKKKRKPNI